MTPPPGQPWVRHCTAESVLLKTIHVTRLNNTNVKTGRRATIREYITPMYHSDE